MWDSKRRRRLVGAMTTALVLFISLSLVLYGAPEASATGGQDHRLEIQCGEDHGTTTTKPTTTSTTARCKPTTTTTEEVTTTEKVTTTEEVTTTMRPTTTVPNEVLPTVVTTTAEETTTTGQATTTTAAVVSSVAGEAATLPFTGSSDLGWVVLAASAIMMGSILVAGSRRQDT